MYLRLTRLTEFLNDAPQEGDAPVRCPIAPHDDREADALRAIAGQYESRAPQYLDDVKREALATSLPDETFSPQTKKTVRRALAQAGQLPVEPGTWVRCRRGVGRVAFVLSETSLYVADLAPAAPPRIFTDAMAAEVDKREKRGEIVLQRHILRRKVATSKGAAAEDVDNTLKEDVREKNRPIMKRINYPRTTPTAAELVPFARSHHRALLECRHLGHSPALAEGERVLVFRGEHTLLNGFITSMRETWQSKRQRRVKFAKVVPPSPTGEYEVKKKQEGVYVELADLVRHGLDLCYKLLVHDRVRVVSGLYAGAMGRVAHISNDGMVTISVPNEREIVGGTIPSHDSPLQKLFVVTMGFVRRDWHLGDIVRVRWGEGEGRVGVIVGMDSGVLKLFDVSISRVFSQRAHSHNLQTSTPPPAGNIQIFGDEEIPGAVCTFLYL